MRVPELPEGVFGEGDVGGLATGAEATDLGPNKEQ